MTDRNVLAIVENEAFGITEEDGCPNCGSKIFSLKRQTTYRYTVDISASDSCETDPHMGASDFETVTCPKCGRRVEEDGTVLLEGKNKSGT